MRGPVPARRLDAPHTPHRKEPSVSSLTLPTAGRLLSRPAGTGANYYGPATRNRFLVTGEESGGAYFAMEAIVPPGGGPAAALGGVAAPRPTRTGAPRCSMKPPGPAKLSPGISAVAAKSVGSAPRSSSCANRRLPTAEIRSCSRRPLPTRCAGRGDGDDAPGDRTKQQVGQREVAEVVRAEQELEAVRRARERRGHHAGVVDEQVQLALPGCRERADGGEAREVEPADLRLAGYRRGGGGPALVRVADGEDIARARAGERAGGGAADAAVGAGDDDAAAGHVGDVAKCSK
jgi:hypothetical protein